MKSTLSACLGGSIVRVSGMVGFEEESGRSLEGLDGRLGEDMVGVRVLENSQGRLRRRKRRDGWSRGRSNRRGRS